MKIISRNIFDKHSIGVTPLIKQIAQEIAVMRIIDDQNIIRLHEVIDDNTCPKIYLGLKVFYD